MPMRREAVGRRRKGGSNRQVAAAAGRRRNERTSGPSFSERTNGRTKSKSCSEISSIRAPCMGECFCLCLSLSLSHTLCLCLSPPSKQIQSLWLTSRPRPFSRFPTVSCHHLELIASRNTSCELFLHDSNLFVDIFVSTFFGRRDKEA